MGDFSSLIDAFSDSVDTAACIPGNTNLINSVSGSVDNVVMILLGQDQLNSAQLQLLQILLTYRANVYGFRE